MSRLSQSQKIVELLKANPNEKFNARQIAEQIVNAYPEDYRDKRQNPRFADEKAFISQVVAEIGSQKDQIVKNDAHVFWQDKPRPRVYWYNPDKVVGEILPEIDEGEDDTPEVLNVAESSFSEHDLYPILIDYLKTELNLYCQRIDEKRSKNSRGSGGNQWLHPDIVAMQPVDKEWNELIRSCVKQGAGQSVRLWSFEVKKELTGSNARKSFFQAVSNSSWANEGYLVATSISDSSVEQELRMLSALHGIGVILLNPENPSESEMMLPAKSRAEVDWQSVNRILVENADFKDYIELVSTYYQTGRVRSRDWNK
ncbi:HrgA protein [Pseudoalteromonas aliena]|uniref:HrgA protein n=1 Tax=Pseudoalteromonas aliena TaxID=247523 RepID=A0A1Q2GUI8_9GAMM|nr:HrgA protein [Pseudoalteromonas aliena]AQP98775.1 HrgA protein [Pseudoalteromonas aliena]